MSSITSASELKGLYAAKRALQGFFERASPVHAVLLFGEEGAGKSTLARLLAKHWMCLQPGPEGPCGECRACRAMEKGSAPDFLRIWPRGASSLITLGAIYPDGTEVEGEVLLSAQEFLRTIPLQARAKVVWIQDADRMNSTASNALLKTLEEPQDYARFVLTTTEVSRVLPTIRSRCMAIPCELPVDEELSDLRLVEWEAALSRRSPGMAYRLRANAEVFEAIYDFAKRLKTMHPEAALAASDEFRRMIDRLKEGEDSKARAAGASGVKALTTAMASLQFPPEAIQRAAESHRRILGNANPAIELDALFASILLR